MEVKTCEEFVLGYVNQLEAQRTRLEEKNENLQKTIDYADKVISIFKQIMAIEKRAVNEKDKPLEEAWVLAPTTGGVKLDLDSNDGRTIFTLLTPLIGDAAAKEELEKMRAMNAEEESKED